MSGRFPGILTPTLRTLQGTFTQPQQTFYETRKPKVQHYLTEFSGDYQHVTLHWSANLSPSHIHSQLNLSLQPIKLANFIIQYDNTIWYYTDFFHFFLSKKHFEILYDLMVFSIQLNVINVPFVFLLSELLSKDVQIWYCLHLICRAICLFSSKASYKDNDS